MEDFKRKMMGVDGEVDEHTTNNLGTERAVSENSKEREEISIQITTVIFDYFRLKEFYTNKFQIYMYGEIQITSKLFVFHIS